MPRPIYNHIRASAVPGFCSGAYMYQFGTQDSNERFTTEEYFINRLFSAARITGKNSYIGVLSKKQHREIAVLKKLGAKFTEPRGVGNKTRAFILCIEDLKTSNKLHNASLGVSLDYIASNPDKYELYSLYTYIREVSVSSLHHGQVRVYPKPVLNFNVGDKVKLPRGTVVYDVLYKTDSGVTLRNTHTYMPKNVYIEDAARYQKI